MVVTTSRADYGLWYWVLRELERDERVTLQLVVGGAHFSVRHGLTYRRVRADGFGQIAEIRAAPRGDSDESIALATGRLTEGVARALGRLRPDIVAVLGDRHELLGVAAAVAAFRLPLVHLMGGDVTAGAVDDAVRNAITKLSHFHLVAAADHARRLLAMGEEPWRIRVVGSPALDHLSASVEPWSKVLAELGVPDPDARPLLLVTLHPTTLLPGSAARETEALFDALSGIAARIVITSPNADQEHEAIRRRIRRFRSKGSVVRAVADLGSARYWSLMRAADAMVGNSSSGLIEAPALGLPVVNIGDRQRGRLRAGNVIDVAPNARAIREGIRRALDPAFARAARKCRSPYGPPGASRRIARVLATLPLTQRLLDKVGRT
jgi:UDP-hydrolysing UDP-N-acetyl-D-glucosamine 2-epimerase